ncbi:hypothetical protein ACLUEY_01395 [Vreelandella aquamarina]
MNIEITVALIGLVGSIAGAAIGSGAISYFFKVKSEKTEADRRVFEGYKSILSDDMITTLSYSDFYVGVSKEAVRAVYEIVNRSQQPGFLRFHDKALNSLSESFIQAAKQFSKEVPSLTVPSNNLDTFTTHTDRTDDWQLADRNRRESHHLEQFSNQVVKTSRLLDEQARKRLRI